MKRLSLLVATLLFGAAAQAEQFVQDGEFIVHYAAVPSTSITPDVARQFGIRRDKRFALLMINAQRGTPRKNVSIRATGQGSARNLVGHKQDLRLRPAREGEVHYLLAEVEVLNQEVLKFELSVTPEGAPRPIAIRFEQQFYWEVED